jgi:hypothetical protein
MYQIICVSNETNIHSKVACGFVDEREARETAQDWIGRQFTAAAYDRAGPGNQHRTIGGVSA